MAIYYVRPDGNDSNTGLGSSAGQAWLTITKAMGATGISSGDTVYVAPGTYRSATGFVIATVYTSATQMLADPTAAQFSGIAAGPVRLSVFTPTDTSAGTSSTVLSGTTNNLTISGFEIYAFTGSGIDITSAVSTIVEKCVIFGAQTSNRFGIQVIIPTANSSGTKVEIRNCIVIGFHNGIYVYPTVGSGTAAFADIYECFCLGQVQDGIGLGLASNQFVGVYGTTYNFYNNVVIGVGRYGIQDACNAPAIPNVTNNLVLNCNTGLRSAGNRIVATFNRVLNCTVTGSVTFGATNSSTGIPGIDVGQGLLHGLTSLQFGGSYLGSPNTSFGTTGLNTTDLFGVTYSGTSPDAGAITYRSLATLTPTYQPTDRQASAITIAPGSTSQSIDLYLGATGLTFSTSGLAAYYVRNQSAPVAITLVTQTPTGAWTSGGFAEISSTFTPGVYRLDVPNAAFAAGASDVTIVVRGASGTNGAVLTVTLSSGGLTAAQTAAAVWDEARSGHTTVGTFGQYVNAELVTPVTSAALVRMGPFEVRADGLGASDPLDIQKGAQHGIDIQCVDNNGAGIDITSATVTAKIYNSGATLVSTLACTATYAADGRATFTLTTAVTNTPGTYTATITRTTGASDTQVFGPLRIYVRDI
jgi:hypothetical protein